ncbi:hypothetical protein BDN71DRAFT_1173198 [Pleurotus eryngii]|uniref:Uncharacterized protein n=1 Tax=Pleurotus eryngii TaxID=5323 RepID=A0A9P5ZUV9_PLEER|nr:hypothetical protein BDN71DRAFT_1173198 [Pleurotus eryngii]
MKSPASPPKTWANRNLTPLFFYAWSPSWRCLGFQLQLIDVFMTLWHDSPPIAAARRIPNGCRRRRCVVPRREIKNTSPRLNPKHILVCS